MKKRMSPVFSNEEGGEGIKLFVKSKKIFRKDFWCHRWIHSASKLVYFIDENPVMTASVKYSYVMLRLSISKARIKEIKI